MAGAAAPDLDTSTTSTVLSRTVRAGSTDRQRHRRQQRQLLRRRGAAHRIIRLFGAATSVSALLLLLLLMASEATAGGGAGAGAGGHRSHNSMLFLRHIPHPSHDLEGGAYTSHASSSSGGGHGHGSGRPGSPSRRLHHHVHPLDEEDKAKPLQGRGALLSRTKVLLRRAMDSVGWPLAASPQTATAGGGGGGMATAGPGGRQQHTPPPPSAAGGAGSSMGAGAASAYSSLLAFARWRSAGSLDGSGAGGAAGGGAASASSVAASMLLRPRPAGLAPSYRHYPFSREPPRRGLKVGPLLAAPPGRGAGEEQGGGSALERISISMENMDLSAASCPVELVAPCAVPSASLKEQGVQREEGLVVPASFLVGDVVDFVTRMSKLDRYSSKNTSRSLERIFVTDCGRLVGYVTSMDLLVHENSSPLLSIVRACEVVVKESDEYDDAILAMREKGLTYAPVVDDNNIVTGIITPTDMLNEMEMEATDDVSRFSGSGGTESYFGTPLVQLVTARAWWLISLLMLQSLSSIILTHFSALIERHLVIALFLTMLTGTAGNAGNQSSAMVIRGLATGEINRRNGWKVVMRELKAAFFMSLLLAAASFVRVYVTPGSTMMSTVAVTIAMGVTVVAACFLGTFAPLVLDRMGLDPCNCASPALATMTDVGGVLILCAISSAMLG